MKKVVLIAILVLTVITGCINSRKEIHATDSGMDWWRDARFGMFIHWGLYSIPAGEWEGSTGHAEWIRTTARIPLDEYGGLVGLFNPVDFDAADWVAAAKDAGMRYIVITSKHHDGFCLFDSEHTDFDVMSTPFKRDILKELSDECRKQGIEICWYHSIMDWHHPDYLPRRDWEKARSTEGADFDRYIEYMKSQLAELLTNYGEIGVLWFDGEWEDTWTHEMGVDLYDYVRSLQQSIIINNRVDKGRQGMAGMTLEGEYRGDFGTPEQEIPAKGIPGVDWESCMTMNDHWGYNRLDNNWKSGEDLVMKLCDIASKGGNFLLNVGPKPDGTFPQESLQLLKEIGDWMDVNSESIYGTTASPFENTHWGRCTARTTGKGKRLYLHLFDIPADHRLVISGLQNRVKAVSVLGIDTPVKFERSETDLVIELPANMPSGYVPVVAVDIKGVPEVIEAPLIQPAMSEFVGEIEFGIENPSGIGELRYDINGDGPGPESQLYEGMLASNNDFTVRAAVFVKGHRVSGISEMSYQQVKPIAPGTPNIYASGLKRALYEGDWDSLPDLAGVKPAVAEIVTLPSLEGLEGREYYALQFTGYIRIPGTGMYKFLLTSDDGSSLSIDGHPVVDNNGLHSAVEAAGYLPLAEGFHAIGISYFQKTGGSALSLRVEGPGFEEGVSLEDLLFY